MDINNGTKTPTDTRVNDADAGMGDPFGSKREAAQWRTIQPGETVRYDLTGSGPWKVEFRTTRGGRRRIVSEIAKTPQDFVELIEAEGGVDVRITRPRASASR